MGSDQGAAGKPAGETGRDGARYFEILARQDCVLAA
jgi:hypothetical protein